MFLNIIANLYLIFIILLFSACSFQSQTNITFAMATATPPDNSDFECTALPEGMTFHILHLNAKNIKIILNGLQPGEEILIIYHRDVDRTDPRFHMGYFESRPAPIGPDGHYEEVAGDEIVSGFFEPLHDLTSNRWVIQVVHARGVACQKIVMP